MLNHRKIKDLKKYTKENIFKTLATFSTYRIAKEIFFWKSHLS